MRALTWHGRERVQVDSVPDPKILNPRDAIIKITSTAICGSDLHIYDNLIPSTLPGDILGHEFMGEVVEVGREISNVRVGDRVVVPFTISCGRCFYCERQLFSLCDNSNPNAWMAEAMYGHSPAGLYGYSHMMGGYAGGQAEYARVPYADVDLFKVPDGLTDEQVLFTTDILATAYMAAEGANIQPGDTVAVWGCGPVGLLTIKCAYLLGAEKVIAIDQIPERLEMAERQAGAEILDYSVADVVEALKMKTGGRGPDVCIDAVGMEAHALSTLDGILDRAKIAVRLTTDMAHVLRESIQACRKGGTVSVAGVYGGFPDKIPFGAAFNKGLKFVMGQTHVQRYIPMLLDRIQSGEIDATFVITHRLPLEEAPNAYRIFKQKQDGCIKVVLKP